MTNLDINPNRGYGTGAGRRKREVTKQSIYFDKNMWEATRLIAQRRNTNTVKITHSAVLRQAMQIGVDAIGVALMQNQNIKFDEDYEPIKRSIFFDDDVWGDAYRLSMRLGIDHSVVIRYAIRIGVEAMKSEASLR